MSLGHSPRIVTDGMVLCLDAANPKNFNLTEVEVLVVAGGGSGGVDNGGGGGAGGLIYHRNFAVTPGSALTVTVGAGGAARSGASDDGPGNNGGNSVFGALTAYGGGGGSGWTNTTLPPGSSSYTGGNGAGQSASTGGVNSLGAGTGNRVTGTTTVAAGQGNNGGTAVGGFAGGGGGAGGPGGNASSGAAGAGGAGFQTDISGTNTIYAAGGAGGWDVASGYSSIVPFTQNGTVKKTTQTAEDACPANTGHGGNGGNHNNNSSGAGGSGIVIVRYPGPQKAIGGTVTSVGGHTIHTFTTVGSTTFTPLVATNNSAILGLSDLSGNGNFGTTANSPTYSTSNQGAIVFDGSNDYIDLNTNNIITGTNPFTFEAFYKVTNASVAAELFGNYGTSYTTNTIWISGRYGVWINQSIPYFQGAPLGLGTYHMAFTRTSAGACTLYKNGVVDGTATSTTSISPGQNFRIGSDVNGIAEVFGGELYCLRVYDKALSAAEISQNFNALRGRYGI